MVYVISLVFFLQNIHIHVPNCADVLLRIYSLIHSLSNTDKNLASGRLQQHSVILLATQTPCYHFCPRTNPQLSATFSQLVFYCCSLSQSNLRESLLEVGENECQSFFQLCKTPSFQHVFTT